MLISSDKDSASGFSLGLRCVQCFVYGCFMPEKLNSTNGIKHLLKANFAQPYQNKVS